MADVDRILSSLTNQLQNYQVEERGLSFFGRSLKLNCAEDAKIVTDQIDEFQGLEFLNLDGNTIGIEAAKEISRSLSKHGSFKQAIWKNMFTGRTKEEIPPALTHLGAGIISAGARLVELDLSDNAFGPIGVEGLDNLIHSPSFHSLQILRLNNNGLGITGGKLLAKSLQDCYELSGKKFSLRVFQAGRNRLENPGAHALAKVFKMIGTLVEVSMPQNGIYASGISALSEAFRNNPHLKTLNLNDNTVQKEGAEALAKALPGLQNLETLNLGDCLLKTKGALCIANALSSNHPKLQTLILEHNEINLDGGLEIAKAMLNKSSLLFLNLNGNRFGENGIDKINEILRQSKLDTALQSFSEDEGSEDEDEEDDDENGVSQEGSESDSYSTDDSNLQDVTGKFEDISLPQVTVAEFMAAPNSDHFIGLGLKSHELFIAYFETSEKDDFIKNALVALLAVSNLTDNNETNVRSRATSCALQLYKYLFEWAIKNEKVSLLTNAILVQLRLIKAEEKSTLIECNTNTCVEVLRKVIQENDIIPKSSVDIVKLFLEKRSRTS